ncbi:hypothetical protein JMJ77_0005216, partial [Colletotrichum scovillei]
MARRIEPSINRCIRWTMSSLPQENE